MLDEKYNCILCTNLIKKEKPYICYQCQKIFHEKCLKDWDNKWKLHHKNFECPNCRNILSLENWKKKLDHEDDRIENANLLNNINELKLVNNVSSIINIIQDKKIKKYEDYINQTIIIFKNILNKINIIRNTMKMENNNKLNDLINNYNLNIENLNISNISNIINEELDDINKNLLSNNKLKKYENIINLVCEVNNQSKCNIFGAKFINNNKDNIELIINGKYSKLIDRYELKAGENIITLLIKNKLSNLSYMFYKCDNLKAIKELNYSNVNGIKDFSYMFYKCSSLTDIKPLENLDVSNADNFESMFYGCSSLLDIKPLENWNVSNVNNFSYMFFKCSSLLDIKPLENWNVSNGNNFSCMFYGCLSLSDIKPLQKWKDFKNMFDNDI